MTKQVATEIGDNWSVFFFKSPTNMLRKVLVDLFQYVEKIEEARIPHFMNREFVITKGIGTSLRVLRDKDDAKIVDSKLVEFFEKEKLGYQKDPEGNRHAWIPKGRTNAKWNRKRCEALHQLSKLVVFLAQNDIFSTDDRCHFAHYAVNMLILQEATLPGSDKVSFLDIIKDEARSFHTLQLRVR